jgi:hypothetical protein
MKCFGCDRHFPSLRCQVLKTRKILLHIQVKQVSSAELLKYSCNVRPCVAGNPLCRDDFIVWRSQISALQIYKVIVSLLLFFSCFSSRIQIIVEKYSRLSDYLQISGLQHKATSEKAYKPQGLITQSIRNPSCRIYPDKVAGMEGGSAHP